jgi:hypothetical protein
MLSIGLWRWYINTYVTFLDIIHHPVFYLKQHVSETRLCLQVESGQLDSINIESIRLLDRRQGLALSIGPK